MSAKKQHNLSRIMKKNDYGDAVDATHIIQALEYLVQQSEKAGHDHLTSVLKAALLCLQNYDQNGTIPKATPEASFKIILFLEKFLSLEEDHQDEIIRMLQLSYIEELLNEKSTLKYYN